MYYNFNIFSNNSTIQSIFEATDHYFERRLFVVVYYYNYLKFYDFGPHLYNKIGNKTKPLKIPNKTIPKYILK